MAKAEWKAHREALWKHRMRKAHGGITDDQYAAAKADAVATKEPLTCDALLQVAKRKERSQRDAEAMAKTAERPDRAGSRLSYASIEAVWR